MVRTSKPPARRPQPDGWLVLTRADAPQGLDRRPQGRVTLDRALGGKAGAEGCGGQPPARREREKRVEQWLRLPTEERFVMRPPDADVEAAQSAAGAFGDHVREQDQAWAVAGIVGPRVAGENRGEARVVGGGGH